MCGRHVQSMHGHERSREACWEVLRIRTRSFFSSHVSKIPPPLTALSASPPSSSTLEPLSPPANEDSPSSVLLQHSPKFVAPTSRSFHCARRIPRVTSPSPRLSPACALSGKLVGISILAAAAAAAADSTVRALGPNIACFTLKTFGILSTASQGVPCLALGRTVQQPGWIQ